MRRFVARLCVIASLFFSLSYALDLNSTYYTVYEKPGPNGQTIIYIVPKKSVLILASEPIIPVMFMPNLPGFTAIIAADGSFGGLTQVNYNADSMAGLGASLSTGYKLYGGDFSGDGQADFLLQGSGSRSSVVIATDNTTGQAAVYYDFGTALNGIAVSTSDTDGNGRTDIIAGAKTYLSSSYGAWFEDSSNGGSTGGALNSEVGVTQGTFKVNESGAATYSIPVVTVPGTAGVAPQVSLNYSSQAGGGIVGRGWSIGGLSAITRCRQTRQQDGAALPITWTNADRFCLDGQRLVVTSGGYGSVGSTYATEIDSYIRVTAVGGNAGNPSYFKVERKDGSTSYFGTDPANTSAEAKVNNPNGITLTWALRRFEDSVGNPIYFTYYNDGWGQRIREIRYAYGLNRSNVDAHSARVEFAYEGAERFDKQTSFVAGYRFIDSARLASINSYNGATQIRSYKLAYLNTSARPNKTSRLETVQECVESTCLPVTRFEWAADFSGFSDSVTASTALNLQDDRSIRDVVFGDINGDGCSDAAFLITDRDWTSSSDDDDDELSYSISNCAGLLRESFSNGSLWIGFSGTGGKLKFLDYNGDGRADLLVFHPNWGSWRVLLSEPQNDGAWRLASTAIDTGLPDKFLSLLDIDADGLTDAAYVKDFKLRSRSLSAGGQPIGSQQFYSFGAESPWQTYNYGLRFNQAVDDGFITSDSSVDFNGDGLVDFYRDGVLDCRYECYPSSPADVFVTRPNFEINQFEVLPQDWDGIWRLKTLDVNKDGLTDILYTPYIYATGPGPVTTGSYLRLSTGQGFAPPIMVVDGITAQYASLADVNGDEFPDFLSFNAGSWAAVEPIQVALWNPNLSVFESPSTIRMGDVKAQHRFADVNGDGISDYIKIDRASIDVFLGKGADKPRNVLTKIINGLGAETRIDYSALSKSSDRIGVVAGATSKICKADLTPFGGQMYTYDCSTRYVDKAGFYSALNGSWDLPSNTETLGKSASSPILEFSAPLYLVTRVEGSAPQTMSTTAMGGMDHNKFSAISYRYSEAKIQASGRGLLGFQKLTTIDEQSSVRTTTTYRQDFPFIGSPLRTDVYTMDTAGNKKFLRASLSTWGFQNYGQGHATAPYKTVLKGTKDFVYDPTGTNVVLTRVDNNSTYDAAGNVTGVTTTTYEGDGTTLVATKSIGNTYFSAESGAIDTGRLKRVQVTHSRPNQDSVTRISDFEYYGIGGSGCSGSASQKGMLCKEIIEPLDAAYTLTTTHEYDNFGNHAKTTLSGSDIGSRFTRWEYDTTGRFKEKTFNSLNIKVEEVSSRNSLGQPLVVKGVNGIQAEFRYTTFGRQYFQAANDGSETTTLRYKTVDGCPAGTVIADVVTQRGGGRSVTCSDRLARNIRTIATLPGNLTAYTDTEYDNIGQVKFVSEPYFPSQGGPRFATQKYDLLGRPTEVKHADDTTTQQSYSGLLVTTTDALTHSKTEQKNALGELSKVTDALGGTIEYVYYADGTLKSTTVASTDRATGVPASIITTLTYDKLGRKSTMVDPDKGTWSYTYYANGELKTQTDAKLQTSSMQYDALGRLTSRIDCNNTSANCASGTKGGATTWVYIDDTATSRSVLDKVEDTVTGYKKTYQYDEIGRVKNTTTSFGTAALYIEGLTYDSYGRMSRAYDAAGLNSGIENVYDAYSGAVVAVKDIASNAEQQRALDIDAKGRVTREMVGITTINRTFRPGTGLITSINTYNHLNSQIQRLSYDYDAVGNLKQRWDQSGSKNVMETLSYDELNRLKTSDVTGPSLTGISTAVQYDGYGNIRSKSGVDGVKNYEYATAAGPHAATKVGSTTYAFDANGSNTSSSDGRQITYGVFDKPLTIAKGGFTSQFSYGPNREVFKRTDTSSVGSTTTILTVGSVEFVTLPGGSQEVRRMLPGGIQIVTSGSQAPIRRHFLKDHLGSIDIVVNDNGLIEQGMSFDAWGLRRTILQTANLWQPFDVAGLTTFNHQRTTKGYTGHEMLDEVGIIHMGGRIYDPRIGRFLQADPVLQAPGFTQSYNRYSYVVNNPLTLIDSSGYRYTWLDDGGGAGVVIATAFNVLCEGCAWQALVAINGAIGAINASAQGGNVAAGAFTGALMGGLSAYFGPVGEWSGYQYATYAVAGGITSTLQGGNFGNGFVSAGLTVWGGQKFGAVTGLNSTPVGTVAARAIVGGTASALTDGKFANGAAFAAAVAAIQTGLNELAYTPGGSVACIPADACSGSGGLYEPEVSWRAAASAMSNADAKYAATKVLETISYIAGPEIFAFKAIGMIGKAAPPTAKQLAKFEKQLLEHGEKSLEKSQKKIEGRLQEHLEKLDKYKAEGGFTSSIEREIRNFERELEAIKQTLGGG
jgi:RHS repeat-associated protein